MKKLNIIIVIAISLISLYFIFNNEREITNKNSKGDGIIAFGDSLVQGVGATKGNDFISLLSRNINQPIINLGVSGNTTRDGLARIDDILEKNKNPKIVILLLGGNDYLKKVPIDETFDNLGKIVDKIHASGSMVLLLGVRGGLILDIFDDRFEDFAEEYKVAFVPNILDGLIGNSKYMSDSIHPNDVGYRKIADKIEPVLEKLIE